MKRRQPVVNLEACDQDPPPLPTALQIAQGWTPPSANAEPTPPGPDLANIHRDRELRARALELAVNTHWSWPLDTTDFTAEHAAELNIRLADSYLAYINGDQP